MSEQDVDLPDGSRSLTPAADARIEAYLDRALGRGDGLSGSGCLLPPSQSQELRLEMRAHVEALIDAYRELGSTDDEAVAEALRRFGEARVLRREVSASALRADLLNGWTAVFAAGALGLSTMAAVGVLLLGAMMSETSLLAMVLAGPLLPMASGMLLSRTGGRRDGQTLYRLMLISLAAVPVAAALPGAAATVTLADLLTRLDLCFVATIGTCGLEILRAAWARRCAARCGAVTR